jgi:hypothetical protein
MVLTYFTLSISSPFAHLFVSPVKKNLSYFGTMVIMRRNDCVTTCSSYVIDCLNLGCAPFNLNKCLVVPALIQCALHCTAAKKWSGFGQELHTDADNFGVSFPVDLGVRSEKSSSLHMGFNIMGCVHG